MSKNNMIRVPLPNGQAIRVAQGTSEMDIQLAVDDYMSSTNYKAKMDYRQGALSRELGIPYNPPIKDIDLDPKARPPKKEDNISWFEKEGLITAADIAGGYYGAQLGFKLAPNFWKPAAGIAGGLVGAGIAASAGTYAQHSFQEAIKSPLADDRIEDTLHTALKNGGEAALIDGIAGIVFNRAEAGVRLLTKGVQGNAEMAALQAALYSQGTTLTLGQTLDDTIFGAVIRSSEELFRGAVFGQGSFKVLDKKQKKAFLTISQNTAENIAGHAVKILRPEVYGRIIQSIHRAGDRSFRRISEGKYRFLDEAIGPITRMRKYEKDVETYPIHRGTDAMGSKIYPTMKEGYELVKVNPVDVKQIRQLASQKHMELESLGLLEKNKEGVSILKSIGGGSLTDLTFRETHKLLSSLKRMQRGGKLEGDPGSVELNGLINMVDSAFNQAGDALGGDLTKKYKAARDFYKSGSKTFNSDLVKSMVEKLPSSLGTWMARESKIEHIEAVRKMVYETSKLGGKGTKKLDFDKTWKLVQAGAMAELMPRAVRNLTDSPIWKVGKGDELDARLVLLVGENGLENIIKSRDAMESILKSHTEKGALTSRQVGAGITYAAAVGSTYQAGSTLGAMGILFAAPMVTGWLFTRPKFVNTIVSYSKNPLGSAARKRLAAKVGYMIHQALKDPDMQKAEQAYKNDLELYGGDVPAPDDYTRGVQQPIPGRNRTSNPIPQGTPRIF